MDPILPIVRPDLIIVSFLFAFFSSLPPPPPIAPASGQATQAADEAEAAREQVDQHRSKAEECTRDAAANPEALAVAEQAAAEAMRLAEQAQVGSGMRAGRWWWR